MRSPLRWRGGKARLSREILACMPRHEAYVETCCGGAGVFWAKPREASSAEILNDVDEELINFYHLLHRSGRRLARTVDAMPYSRAWFGRMRRAAPTDSFHRAARFWYCNRVSFGAIARGCTFGVKATKGAWVLPRSILADLEATVERLRGVIFECLDVARLVRLYDRPTTLFYLDPPYVGPRKLYACDFEAEDHRRLAEALRGLQGTWLLSYDDHPAVRDLYAGLPRRRLEITYSLRANARSGGKRSRELLISNRPLPRAGPDGRGDRRTWPDGSAGLRQPHGRPDRAGHSPTATDS